MKHGECKTLSGQLIAIDLEVESGRMKGVCIRGDFFTHPESAKRATLDSIAAGLQGAPEDLEIAALAARVRAAVPFGVELVGTTPEGIAEALRRAVVNEVTVTPALNRVGAFTSAEIDHFTDSWLSFDWQIIPERPLSPALNVALDEVLTERVASGLRPPTLRFWRWTEPAVIIGRTQAVENEVDLVAAAAMGITVVRRMTGGGAMLLQPHGAITYSLYLPERAVTGLSIRQSYEVCEAWVIRGLRSFGVDAHHVPINDIACSAGKIGGAAQARRKGVVLHHTTIAYDMDPGEMVKVLRIGREKIRDKGTASAAKEVSPLVRQTGLSREAIVEHLLKAFQTRFGGRLDMLTANEMIEAEQLVVEKYGTEEWTRVFG